MEILSNIITTLITAAIVALAAGAGVFLGKTLKAKKTASEEEE